jgi:hypothetical protein
MVARARRNKKAYFAFSSTSDVQVMVPRFDFLKNQVPVGLGLSHRLGVEIYLAPLVLGVDCYLSESRFRLAGLQTERRPPK